MATKIGIHYYSRNYHCINSRERVRGADTQTSRPLVTEFFERSSAIIDTHQHQETFIVRKI